MAQQRQDFGGNLEEYQEFDADGALDAYFNELIDKPNTYELDEIINPFQVQDQVIREQPQVIRDDTLRLVEQQAGANIQSELHARQFIDPNTNLPMMEYPGRQQTNLKKKPQKKRGFCATITTGDSLGSNPQEVPQHTQLQPQHMPGQVGVPPGPSGQPPIQSNATQPSLRSSGSLGSSEAKSSKAANLAQAVKEPTSHKDKQQKVLEKNRRAQKKFREKQKTRTVELEKQVHELTSALEKLRTETSDLGNQRDMLQKLVELRDNQIKALWSQDDSDLTDVPPLGLNFGNKARDDDPQLQITRDQMKQMTPEQVAQYWKRLVNRLAPLLVEVEEESGKPSVTEEIERLVDVAGSFCSTLALLNPFSAKKIVGSNMESWEWVDKDDQHYKSWTPVVNSLELSANQKQKIVAMLRNTVAKQKQLRVDRIQLHQVFQDEFDLESMRPKDLTIKERNVQSMKMHQAALSLKRNLEETHVLYGDFITGVLFQVLTKLQLAMLIVRYWPFYPDPFTLATCLLWQDLQQDENQKANDNKGTEKKDGTNKS